MQRFHASSGKLLEVEKHTQSSANFFQRSFLRKEENSLLSTLPPRELWLKRGLVERRTVHANVIWRERQMILTKDSIYFARPDSDIVVDKVSIEEIVSVVKVDNFEKKGVEYSRAPSQDDMQQFGRLVPSTGKSGKVTAAKNGRRGSTLMNKVESLEAFQDGVRETFAFEIKTYSALYYRSYFVRCDSLVESDQWIEELNTTLKLSLREHARKGNWLQMRQKAARDLYDHHYIRCVIALAILCDFLSSVFESEFFGNHVVADVFGIVDVVLCTFFMLELSLSILGNWTNFYGTPFVLKMSNWFLVATVLFQLSGFFLPNLDLKHIKVVRIIRLFDVGRAFKSLASCQMVLKAIRQGWGSIPLRPLSLSEPPQPCDTLFCLLSQH
jgi:hypothetical protein